MTDLAFPTIVTSRRTVPNVFPIRDSERRIAIVGEAPGEQEENYNTPFVGPSGNLLNGLLRNYGVDRHEVYVGNVCQVRPPGNKIERFPWDGEEIQSGLRQLALDMKSFQPNVVLLLGGTALAAAKPGKHKITEWRGSMMLGEGALAGLKCIPSLHPAAVLREWSGFPLLNFDIKRTVDESRTPILTLPQRELITNMGGAELCHILDTWPTGVRCSLDIEGGLNGWPCVSVCARPSRSITIAWGRLSPVDHARVLQSFARLMSRADVPKVLQNSLYDNFVLSYGFGIPISPVVEDTMLKGWEVYCELPKGLGTQASIWTREPFYKAERKSKDTEVYFQYCAKDSAVTLEICNNQDNALSGAGLQHYRLNMKMLNPLLYMELRGINYDKANADTLCATARTEYDALGEKINEMAGRDLRGPKGSIVPARLAKLLYEEKGYPAQYKKENGRNTDKYTTDVQALLSLRRKLPGDALLNGILRHRHLEGRIETLSILPDPDGRVRCGYNVVGTETGRLTCYTSPTGAGANLQTITKDLRQNYRADPGYDFFQCDLAGADGWTVAAHCARLGDPTMIDDYLAGLKPAKIIAMLYLLGPEVNALSREDLQWWGDDSHFAAIKKVAGKWVYDGCKVTQHGSNYKMGIPTMISNLVTQSYKKSGEPTYMEHRDAAALQNNYFLRYHGVRLWHSWAEATLVAKGELTSASGHTRVFFGRRFGPDIHDTVKEFLADEPQQNTT